MSLDEPEQVDSILTFLNGYDTLEYSWVKAIAVSVRLRILFVALQNTNNDRLQPRQRGMHSVKEADMLAMKIDLLKEFEDCSQDKAQLQTLQALETRMTSEVCRNVGHSGDNCPETQEEALFLNGNGFHPQGGQRWNQPRPY